MSKTLRFKGAALLVAVALLLLPVGALAFTAVLNDGFLPWHSVGGGDDVVSTGNGYTLTGAASQNGSIAGDETTGYSLVGGYVPVPPAVETPVPGDKPIWLPVIQNQWITEFSEGGAP